MFISEMVVFSVEVAWEFVLIDRNLSFGTYQVLSERDRDRERDRERDFEQLFCMFSVGIIEKR